ncbi:MAG: peptidoglycan DD-metalloendopeptidase family protein [Betaproteobacteria bacterium]|nr:peptidoglycan DD-metalloendopeptidase family protein [Betaproteobacteria bacterium]MCL2885973.1 peptidoglycan DD-metalloendopeptidase family protein [Betaproteobacteria bacterium]
MAVLLAAFAAFFGTAPAFAQKKSAAPTKTASAPKAASTPKTAAAPKISSTPKTAPTPKTVSPPETASTPEIAEHQADLGELRGRIEALRKELNASEENRADAASRLRDSERQISRLQRELHELAGQRGRLQRDLRDLEQQSSELGATLEQQQAQLERLLYRQYLRGTPDSLQMLLNGDDPNQMARDLRYLSAIAHSRAELMEEIGNSLDKKKSLAAAARERGAELAEVETQHRQRADELSRQRDEHKTLYAEISSKLKAQQREMGELQKDEKRLTQLIDRLSKILAAQAAEAARQKARRDAAPGQTARGGIENRYEPAPSDGSFARQKGMLRLPARGTVSGRFGAPRDGGGTWRGLFIKAASGGEVKAIANGQVVFADWMRGFGNLLIVDHGDAYLSIYGNNDSLLKQVGQTVKGGDAVAIVGNSGGNAESGLYFEIRHQGQPLDPMKWANLK